MEAMVAQETAPEIIAQFIFVMLLAGLMFLIGFVFRPTSRRRRERRAARAKA